jgi:hypothetical protein
MLFTVFLLGLIGRANAAACTPNADNCPKLSDGSYCPVNDVTEHGDSNRDVKQIATFLKESPPNYAKAKEVYTQGMHSSKGSGMRTLQKLAQKDMTVSGKYTNAWYSGSLDLHGSIAAIWDYWVTACLDGSHFCTGKSNDFRKYIINKCAIGIVMGYATYEMGAAVWKVGDGATTDAGAPYAWDEAAAFFIGNIAPSVGDGITGSAPGNLYSPYEFAWKRDKDFPNGDSCHTKSLPIFNYGLINTRGSSANAANVQTAQLNMYKIIAITAIRSALKYSWKASVASGSYSEKYHAEGWAYWRSGSGYIASLSAAAKTKVQEIDALLSLTLTTIPATTPCDVKTKVESLYSALGISCSMVGTWKDASGCMSNACTGSTSGSLISGSASYVDMCKAAPSGTASAGVMNSMPTAAAALAAAAAATCDFA